MATKSAQRITKCHLGPPVTASWDWMTIPPVGGGAGGTGGGGGGGYLLVSSKTAMIWTDLSTFPWLHFLLSLLERTISSMVTPPSPARRLLLHDHSGINSN